MKAGDEEPIFERCIRFAGNSEYARKLGYPGNPAMLQALGYYPYFVPLAETAGTEIVVDGRPRIMLGSNNYLGMTSHPGVVDAARRAIEQFGTGCTGSRLLNGTLEIHLELEERLARFVGKEKAVAFSTGYQTNLGVVAALLRKGDAVFADKEVHASLIDGIHLARGSMGVKPRFFRHNDAEDLERLLAACQRSKGKLVVVDGLYSMSGEVAAIPEIADVCRRHSARLLVDDAHALGVLGGGRGSCIQFDCLEEVDLITGTFSKSFASCGGFVAGPEEVIEWIRHMARPFLFSASLPPANVAVVLTVLSLLEESGEAVRKVNAIAGQMREALACLGYEIRESHGAIVPIVVGDELRAVQAWRRLMDLGVYTNAVVPPAVPPWFSGLRTSYMATHTPDQLDRALKVFADLHPWVEAARAAAGRGR